MVTPRAFGCPNCKASYRMGMETTLVFYEYSPQYNHFVTTCPGCEHQFIVFPRGEQLMDILEHNFDNFDDLPNIRYAEFVEMDIVEHYNELHGIAYKEPEEHELSEAEEAWVNFFHFLLENGAEDELDP